MAARDEEPPAGEGSSTRAAARNEVVGAEMTVESAVVDVADAPGDTLRFAFEQLRVAVGSTLTLTMRDSHTAPLEIEASLVGYIVGRFLIVALAESERLPGGDAEFPEASVHFYAGRGRYGFDTRIDAVFPGLYLHLAYPREVTMTPVRDSPRVRSQLPARLEFAPGDVVEVTVLDLSTHGARVRIAPGGRRPVAGEALRLAFSLATGGDLPTRERFALPAQVLMSPGATVSDPTTGVCAECVLRFDALDERENLHLTNYVMARILESPENLL